MAKQTDRQKAAKARWRATHKEKISIDAATYYAAHKAERAAYQTAYSSANKEKVASLHARAQTILKMAAFNAYGGQKCACCGETLFEGLSIDHIAGGGAAHRRELQGCAIYRWLKKNNYPPGFQVLCGTCNMAKRTGDHCPHEDLRIAWG